MKNDLRIDYELLQKYNIEYLKKNLIIPIDETKIYIQLASYKKSIDIHELENYFMKPVKIIYLDKDIVEFSLKQMEFKLKITQLASSTLSLIDMDNDEKVIKQLVEMLIEYIISLHSSDLHIEIQNNKTIFKARIDGLLEEIFSFSYRLFPMVSAIIKLKANLDIAQKRLPQDGRFSLNVNDIKYDFRVSIVPTINNSESIVVRVLDRSNENLNLNRLGLEQSQLQIIQRNIQRLRGMVLVTGATGSGKTTTIYSIINSINTTNKKIITVEDPVEYDIEGINQINIDEKRGLNFASILKNILRQDPDVIFIGEIRDIESLKIAIQAALTGHLVIATLHTNDTIKTIDRLYDLGAEPFLIASVLKLVISQKLIKKLCPYCKEKYTYDGKIIFREVGCEKCNFSGYDKRSLLVELLEVTPEIEKLIHEKKSVNINIKRSEQLSMKLHKRLLEGEISLEEYMSNAL